MSEGRTVNGEWAGGPVRWPEFQIDVSQVQAKQLWLLKCETLQDILVGGFNPFEKY